MMAFLRNTRLLWRVLLSLLIIIAGLHLLSLIWDGVQFMSDIILLFIGAWVIAFLLGPIVGQVERFHIPRALATGLVYLAFTLIIVGLIALAVPLVSDQLTQVANHLSSAVKPDNLNQINNDLVQRLQSFGMSNRDAHKVIDQLSGDLAGAAQGAIAYTLSNVATLISSVAWILLQTIVMIFLSFYMMLDGRRLMNSMTEMLPASWREPFATIEDNVTRIFGGFIRGQLLIASIYGFFTWIALFIVGITDGFVFSLLSALVMLIPFLGSYLSLIPPMLLVLLESPVASVGQRALLLFIILFILQQVVLQGIAPRIMGHSIGLHPILTIAALLIGAKEGGVWGAFFAAPIAALLVVFLRELHDRLTASSVSSAPPVEEGAPSKPATVAEVTP
jgi:predicted PurR-regulated permease PerM